MTWPATPEQRHRVAAATFAARVRGVTDWGAPSPVAQWRARDVVRHLLEWLPGFLQAGAGARLTEVSGDDADLAASWESRAAQVQQLLETRGSQTYRSPMTGEMPLAEAVDRFYTADVVMHTWDLARATGQDDQLPVEFCAQAYAGMEPVADLLLASGQFGPRVEVPADADPQTRLLGLIGRDPHWIAPGRDGSP
jgi:uncharacterized protein (TIGR03086 family)